jgi:hypothetical protein
MTHATREQVDGVFLKADPGLIDDLGEAIARACVAYNVRLPVGCLTAITKSVLFALNQRAERSRLSPSH